MTMALLCPYLAGDESGCIMAGGSGMGALPSLQIDLLEASRYPVMHMLQRRVYFQVAFAKDYNYFLINP